jgi:hypothetical protein
MDSRLHGNDKSVWLKQQDIHDKRYVKILKKLLFEENK